MIIKDLQKASLLTAIVTPYNPDGSIDWECYGNLLEQQVKANVDGVIVGGTTGEGHLLSWEEHLTLIAFTVNNFGEDLIVVGNTGSNNTRESRDATEKGFVCGMHASLQINPYYGKTSNEGLIRHFNESMKLGPCIIYNVPSRTSQDIPVSVIQELASHKNLVGVKECMGNERIREHLKNGVVSWSGNDPECFEAKHNYGAAGVISVCSNLFPASFRKLMDDPKALSLHKILSSFYSHLYQEPNPIGTKTIMSMMGLIKPTFRLPYVPYNQEKREEIFDFLSKISLVDMPSNIKVLFDEEFSII